MGWLVSWYGALADRHPFAVEAICFALAFVGVGFLICPFWQRFYRPADSRSPRRFRSF